MSDEKSTASAAYVRQFQERLNEGGLHNLTQAAQEIADLAKRIANDPAGAITKGDTNRLAQATLQFAIAAAEVDGSMKVTKLLGA